MKRRTQAGFTLIEVVIALAIASFLIPIVLNGQRETRSRIQFSAGVERLRNELVAIKNEANTTVSVRAGGGTDPRLAAAGRVVTISEAEGSQGSVLTVRPLLFDESASPLQLLYDPDITSTYTIALPWGVGIPDDSPMENRAIVFLRNDDTGRIQTYFPATNRVLSYSTYTQPTSPLQFTVQDRDNHTATITIDPTFGSVTAKVD